MYINPLFMTKAIQASVILLLLTLSGSVAWLTLRADKFLADADATSVAAGETVQSAKSVLDAIGRPCGGANPCGLIAQANKTIVKVGDAVVQTQLTERKATPHVIAAMDELDGTAKALTKTANAGTGTLNAATATLGEGKTTIQAAQPLLAAFTAAANDLDKAIKTTAPRIDATMSNVQEISGATAHIVNDGQRVADDATERYFKPLPWWRKALVPVTAGAKIVSYILPW
jgi:hypothetical protein